MNYGAMLQHLYCEDVMYRQRIYTDGGFVQKSAMVFGISRCPR